MLENIFLNTLQTNQNISLARFSPWFDSSQSLIYTFLKKNYFSTFIMNSQKKEGNNTMFNLLQILRVKCDITYQILERCPVHDKR